MRFSIRDLLWGTALVAMGLAWWMNNQTKNAAVQQAHRLHQSLSVAKQWHNLAQSGYFTTGAKNVLPVPSGPPDFTVLEEQVVER